MVWLKEIRRQKRKTVTFKKSYPHIQEQHCPILEICRYADWFCLPFHTCEHNVFTSTRIVKLMMIVYISYNKKRELKNVPCVASIHHSYSKNKLHPICKFKISIWCITWVITFFLCRNQTSFTLHRHWFNNPNNDAVIIMTIHLLAHDRPTIFFHCPFSHFNLYEPI